MRKLIRATPHKILLRAAIQCRTTITRAILEVDEFGNKRKNVAGLVRATDGDRFVVVMFYEPEKTALGESKVWVHCSCPYYLYHCEVVNAKHKSSDIINSNGQLPLVRNPRMIPHVCKHLVAMARIAVKAKAKDMTKAKEEKEKKKKTVPNKREANKPAQKQEQQKKTYTNRPVRQPPKPMATPSKAQPKPAKV